MFSSTVHPYVQIEQKFCVITVTYYYVKLQLKNRCKSSGTSLDDFSKSSIDFATVLKYHTG